MAAALPPAALISAVQGQGALLNLAAGSVGGTAGSRPWLGFFGSF